MSARFILSPQAERDVDAIAAYIAQDSLDVALRFYDAAWACFEQLGASPGIGRAREVSDEELRSLRSTSIEGFRPFIVFYVPIDDGIRVLRVLHGARDLDSLVDG